LYYSFQTPTDSNPCPHYHQLWATASNTCFFSDSWRSESSKSHYRSYFRKSGK